MEVYPASVALIVKAMIVSARWAGRARSVGLAEMTAAAETSRLAALEARVVSLENAVQRFDTFGEYYNGWRGHRTLGGAGPRLIHGGDT